MTKWFKLSFLAGLTLLCANYASAQGSLYANNAWRYTPAGVFAASGATVTVCTSTATGTPCTPTVTVYSNSTLTTPVANPLPVCTTSPQFGCIDGLGNFSFYATPGAYTYTVTGAGLSAYGPIPVGISCVAGVSCVTTSGSNAFSGANTFAGTTGLNGGGNLSGTFTGNPTLSGNPSFTGAPTFAQLNGAIIFADLQCTTPGVYDGSCLTNAIAACPSGGCIIELLRTFTPTTAQLPIVVNKSVVFQGVSWAQSIVTTADTTKDIFNVTIGTVTFRDFLITRSATAVSGAGINLSTASNELHLINMHVTKNYNNVVTANGSWYLVLDRNLLDFAINDGLNTQTGGMRASHNKYYSNGNNGVTVIGSGGFLSSHDNDWYANKGSCISYNTAGDTFHTNDICDSSGSYGVAITAVNHLTWNSGWIGSSGVTFSGSSPVFSAFTSTIDGMFIPHGANHVIVTGTFFVNNSRHGLICFGCPDLDAGHNTFIANGQAGEAGAAHINIADDGGNVWGKVVLTGNLTRATGGTATGPVNTKYGLSVSGGATGTLTVANNDLSGNVTAPINSGISSSAVIGPEKVMTFFIPGSITGSIANYAAWTPARSFLVTRVQANAQTAPSGCSTQPTFGVHTPTVAGTTIANGANSGDSGILNTLVASGAGTLGVAAADGGCGTHAANINVTVQYVVP